MSLAQNTPDLLADVALAERISGKVAVKKTSQGLLIESTDPACENLTFKLHDLALGGCELTVFADMSAMPRGGYPKQMPRFATLTCQSGYIDFMDGDVPAELSGECVRGASEQPIDTAGGAMVRFRPTLIGTESKKSFAIHPPYKTGKGYVFWMRDVELPTVASDLRFALGMGEKAPSKSDGVWFSVAVAEVRSDGSAGEFIRVFEKNTKAHEWIPCSVALQRWAGKRVRLKFIADCGPRNNCTTDQGYWADVRLVKSGVKNEELTPAQSAMTWLNPQPFEASFYYRGIRSKEIDLIFTVEGNAPVLLHSLSAHVAADARCRIFENGVVLGNPGHQPFIFDLQKIAPGMKLRRLKATELQDSQVNNGEPVVETQLTVAPLDALFLERE